MTSGTTKTVIGDADALIALTDKNDVHHKFATLATVYFANNGYTTYFPNTAVMEAIARLQRVETAGPILASFLSEQFAKGAINTLYVDYEVTQKAFGLFNPKGSRKNTIFDAVVATLAIKNKAAAVFSFDEWYHKQGLTLTKDIVKESLTAEE